MDQEDLPVLDEVPAVLVAHFDVEDHSNVADSQEEVLAFVGVGHVPSWAGLTLKKILR